MRDHDLESTRRSLVMARGTAVTWPSEHALELVEDLIEARRHIRELSGPSVDGRHPSPGTESRR